MHTVHSTLEPGETASFDVTLLSDAVEPRQQAKENIARYVDERLPEAKPIEKVNSDKVGANLKIVTTKNYT